MVNFYTPPKKSFTPKKVTVTVASLDTFGQGVANYKGKTIFVKAALPTETVDIRYIEEKKSYAKAEVIRYHNQSLDRVEPKCRHYKICGGCEMQHVSQPLQHQAKYHALLNLLKKESGADLAEIMADEPEIMASSPYHYRRRARLSINWVNNNLQFGFRKADSKQIVTIKMCPVLVPELESLLLPLYETLQQISQKKALGHIELIATESGTLVVLRHTLPLTEQDKTHLTAFAKQFNTSFYLHGEQLMPLFGQTDHFYLLNQLKLSFSPLDFIQVNRNINQKMVTAAVEWLDLKSTDNVLDLFCGMGNFSLPLATTCKTVVGVEGVATLVEKAKVNALVNRENLIASTSFITCNLDDQQQIATWYNAACRDISSHDIKGAKCGDGCNRDSRDRYGSGGFDKVLLDPARAGAYNAIATIVAYQPTRIVYISCNPATLARDSKLLVDAGYKIARMAILDMFPQTKHVESMLLFIK
ncbi:23S rRNA (uracil(1939)-C(5))-methyltransferase RlmD [Orbaceae bacterium ESL0721]|nr:23S rRNA (uracil(1939)-C(5))-methyltransferase RlmD [Orbaceae bacterium ESL0721]